MLTGVVSTCFGFAAASLFFAATNPPAGATSGLPVIEKCFCKGSYVNPTPSQLTDCGNGPLIVATSPTAEEGDCLTPSEGDCVTKDRSVCKGSVNVKVTYPPSGNTCPTLWVKGGSTYPDPTQINNTSESIALRLQADCRTGVGETKQEKKVSVWKAQPTLVNGIWVPEPDASYTFTLTCAPCERVTSD